jgi:ferredoxin-NADP reductase
MARMEGQLVEGRHTSVKMPYGDSVIDSKSDVVLFAGGTGITAFTAFLEDLSPETQQSVVLAYGARSRPDGRVGAGRSKQRTTSPDRRAMMQTSGTNCARRASLPARFTLTRGSSQSVGE